MNTPRIAIAALFALVSAAHAADPGAPRGQAVFDTQCVRCHNAGPQSLKTDPEKIRSALKTVSHQRFILSEDDFRELIDTIRDTR